MFEPGLGLALQFGDDALGQDLAQLDAPLVKGIDVPYGALGEDAMLVKRNQFTEGGGVNRSSRMMLDGRLPSNTR